MPQVVSECSESSDANTRPTTVRVMVLDLQAASTDLVETARSLSQVIAQEAGKVKGYQILSSQEVASVLDQEAAKQLSGCDESSCLAELAEALDADLLVSGRLDAPPGGGINLTLALLNTRAIVTVNRVALSWGGTADQLIGVARTAAQLLVFDKNQRPPGQIVLESLPASPEVFLDEVDVTAQVIATGAISQVEVGPHVLRIDASSFQPKTQFILVTAKETTRIDGSLEDDPFYTRWWFWSGVTGVALLGAGAGAFGLAFAGTDTTTVSTQIAIPSIKEAGALR